MGVPCRSVWGDYDVPGWTANGVEPWGPQADPIRSDGFLFFRGFFSLLLPSAVLLILANPTSEGLRRPRPAPSHYLIIRRPAAVQRSAACP